MLHIVKYSLFLIVEVLVSTATMRADTLLLSLDSSDLVDLPGSSVTFTGLLQNSSGAEVFLNGAGGDLSYSELTLDVTPFFTFTPLSLADGDSYNGQLFSVAISNVALPGDYSGSFIVQGGADGSTFDTVASTDFQVTVLGQSGVPEPASLVLFGSGVVGLIAMRRWRVKHTEVLGIGRTT